jgi:hypothetical protein
MTIMEEDAKDIAKDLYLTPGPAGGQLYSLARIHDIIAERDDILGLLATPKNIRRWSYEHDDIGMPSWVDLMTLSAKLGLKTADRMEGRTWEETIIQRYYESEALWTSGTWRVSDAALNAILDRIEASARNHEPIFTDIVQELEVFREANMALKTSFVPGFMNITGPARRPKR